MKAKNVNYFNVYCWILTLLLQKLEAIINKAFKIYFIKQLWLLHMTIKTINLENLKEEKKRKKNCTKVCEWELQCQHHTYSHVICIWKQLTYKWSCYDDLEILWRWQRCTWRGWINFSNVPGGEKSIFLSYSI